MFGDPPDTCTVRVRVAEVNFRDPEAHEEHIPHAIDRRVAKGDIQALEGLRQFGPSSFQADAAMVVDPADPVRGVVFGLGQLLGPVAAGGLADAFGTIAAPLAAG